jgi:hypothetical protein
LALANWKPIGKSRDNANPKINALCAREALLLFARSPGKVTAQPIESCLLAIELGKERLVDFIAGNRLEAKFKVLQHIDEFISIDKVDWRCAIPGRFAARLGGKGSSCDDDAFIGTTRHCTAKIADMRGGNGFRVALALEYHLEGNQRIYLEGAMPIDAAITAAAGDDDLDETSLS